MIPGNHRRTQATIALAARQSSTEAARALMGMLPASPAEAARIEAAVEAGERAGVAS